MQTDAAGFAERQGSGLFVPDHLLKDVGGSKDDGAAVDSDGRRRAVMSRDDARKVKRAIDLLKAMGFAIQLRCDDERKMQRIGVPAPCGELLEPEGQGTHDNGFGCRCSRIHLASDPAIPRRR